MTKRIEHPEWSHDKPEGYSVRKLGGGYSTSRGLPVGVCELSNGTVCIVDQQIPHMPRYAVYSSFRAWEICDRSLATRDPEARGGCFFPSDYQRLKITRKDEPSGQTVSGWRHAPACLCSDCGKLVRFCDTKYAHSEETGYMPYCKNCFPF